MRLIFLADIHDAFGPLETLFRFTQADLYILSGDLIYRIFPRYATAWRFMELQEILGRYRAEDTSVESLRDVAGRLAGDAERPAAAALAREYLELSRRAETAMLRAYERMAETLSRFPEERIRVLPGNYDMDLQRTALRNFDLHMQCQEIQGWRIAGYGGAKVYTPGIPDHLQIPFREVPGPLGSKSEAQEFFRATRANILVVHQPAYGHLDRLPGHGHVGSPGIRDYAEEAHPLLVLSGHLHEDWGGERAGGTWYFNPSNFGRVMEISRPRPGGYFLDISLAAEGLRAASLRQVDREGILDVVDYIPKGQGLEMLILDEARFLCMGGRHGGKPRHIRPILQFQRIKSFFLGYESPETRALVQELRGVYRRIRSEGMQVAFDLLGSLNFGMARGGSDLDLVVYLKGEECLPDEVDACAVPRPLQAVFRELEERDIKVEVCDSLDLDRVVHAIREEDREDGHLQRFIFYRAVCRPVNLRLIKSVENQLLSKESFRKEMEARLREYLRILVSSFRHGQSFQKYMARLRDSGVRIPADVEEGIRRYLRG